MSENIICEYCGIVIKNKRSLQPHYKSRRCQDSRGILFIDIKKYHELETEMKELQLCYQELQITSAKYKAQNDIYERLYGQLQQQNQDEIKETKLILSQLASKPTSTTNNQMNIFNQMKPLDLSEQRIIQAVANYTMEHYIKGSIGMVEWIIPNLLMDDNENLTYRCNDKNRYHFYHKNSKGEKVDDIKGENLINSVRPHMLPKMKEFKRIRNEQIMKEYGDNDENYQGTVSLITKKQLENRKWFEESLGPETTKVLVQRIK